MARSLVSRPVAVALGDGLISPGVSVFDYGCGRADDVHHLRQLGIAATGWDPVFAPDQSRTPAEVVNLGFVVNVIEDPAERAAALRAAWGLAKRVLVVAARLRWEANGLAGRRVGDGWVTTKGTFQRFYTQEELRSWIDTTLGVTAIAAAPGIFYVFRNGSDADRLLAERARRDNPSSGLRIADLLFEQHRGLLEPLQRFVAEERRLPRAFELAESSQLVEVFGSVRSAFLVLRRVTGAHRWGDIDVGQGGRSADRRFLEHQEILEPLLSFLQARGRLPHSGELSNEDQLISQLGGIRRAFSLIRRATGERSWAELAIRRRDDFLVYLALSAFGGRLKYSQLPVDLQHDARDFFGSYRAACQHADALLFAAGDQQTRNAACNEAPIGKLTPEALYVHVAELGRVPPVLRVYEGCGRALTGTVDEADLVKLHRLKAQVSYLSYPHFDRDPHPALSTVIISRLATLDVTYRDFRNSDNPPILHRKETFVSAGYPGRDRFARLTEQEQRNGLLDDAAGIGTAQAWAERLRADGFKLRGHRLIRSV